MPPTPRAFLFSGHMIDAPGRASPRFPPALEATVRRAIDRECTALGAGPGDIAVGSGACGSDILFAEALLQRGVALRLYLPFPEPEFLQRSVAFADADWVARYHAMAVQAAIRVATDVLGPLPDGTDPYERTNLWMLDEAQRLAGAGVVFLCVWDGEGGDGPGGTRHMVEAVQAAGGAARRIDPGKA